MVGRAAAIRCGWWEPEPDAIDEWMFRLLPSHGIRYHCAMQNKVAWGLLVSCVYAGCSFGMTSLDPQWSGNSEPKCDRRVGLIVADRIIAGALAGGALTAVVQNADAKEEVQRQAGWIVAGGFAAMSVVFLISQGVGSGRRSECMAAQQKWAGRAPYNPDSEPASAPRAVIATRSPRPSAAAPVAATPGAADAQPTASLSSAAVAAPAVGGDPPTASVSAPADPRAGAGSSFFCTSSPSRDTLNVCMGDQPACEHARQVLRIADLTACAPAQIAWCFETGGKRRCFGIGAVCTAQRAKVTAPAGECSELHR